MLTAIIAEDEPRHRETLCYLLARYCPEVEVIRTIESVRQSGEALSDTQPDILFLDVELGDGECFDILREQPDRQFEIIFTTAHERYAIQAIKNAAIDYLLKPIIPDDLSAAVAKVQHKRRNGGGEAETDCRATARTQTRPQRVGLPTKDGLTVVLPDDIVRCEANGNCTRVYLKDGSEVVVSKRLHLYEELLDPREFVRVHNRHLINLNYVDKYARGKGGIIIMRDGSSVSVSVRKKDALLDRLLIV